MPSHGRGRMIKQLLHTFWVNLVGKSFPAFNVSIDF
ncbi:rCG25697, partial [Rattus norvegicus]